MCVMGVGTKRAADFFVYYLINRKTKEPVSLNILTFNILINLTESTEKPGLYKKKKEISRKKLNLNFFCIYFFLHSANFLLRLFNQP